MILNLAVWFGLHVLFGDVRPTAFGPLRLDVPSLPSVNLAAVALSVAAALALFRFKLGVIPVLVGCAGLGIGLHLAGLA